MPHWPEFVRMLLPMQPGAAREGRSNEDMIKRLKRKSALTCKRVTKAFQVCSRDIFVPDDQKGDAFYDRPVPLDADFNISAPHMHACMIEGLDVQEGERVLDIGSGCGVTSAILAYLVGKGGDVVGVELRKAALHLATSAMQTMELDREYAARACAVTFEHGNAFILPQHEGRFDRVHVGGLCALDKVPALLKLLKPAGGRLVVPSGPELLSITVSHGKVTREVLSTVRFGALETPSDAGIIFGHLDRHRAAALAAAQPPSHFEAEMAAAAAGKALTPAALASWGGDAGAARSDGDDDLDVRSSCTCTSFSLPSHRALSGRFSSAGRSSLSSAGSPPSTSHIAAASPGARRAPPAAAPAGWRPRSRAEVDAALGPPDAAVRGAGFELPVHSAVLHARCPLARAQLASGMRDAAAPAVTLPPDFPEAAAAAAVEWLYTDAAPLDEDTALPTLAVAVYLDAQHLAAACCAFITAHLRAQEVPAAVEAAAQLHIFASEHGLDGLGRFCAAFLAVHIAEARAAPTYRRLGAKELDAVLEAVAGERALLVQRLEALSCGAEALGPEFAAAAARDGRQ